MVYNVKIRYINGDHAELFDLPDNELEGLRKTIEKGGTVKVQSPNTGGITIFPAHAIVTITATPVEETEDAD